MSLHAHMIIQSEARNNNSSNLCNKMRAHIVQRGTVPGNE